MSHNPSIIIFSVSYLLFLSCNEPPAVAITFIMLTFVLFPRTWPINLEPTCAYYLCIILIIASGASSSLSTFGLSASFDKKTWIMSLELGFRLIYFFLASLNFNAATSVLRYSGFLKPNYLAFIFCPCAVYFLPFLSLSYYFPSFPFFP